VMYEFTTYISNDMILPGMLGVVKEFNVSVRYVSLSFTIYILGNCMMQLFLGPLADRFGKRRAILTGNVIFLIFTALVIFVHNIDQFMLTRLFQGCGLAFIAVGYALIHESFNDKQAVKIMAMMGNVSLLAPLLGPLLGSLMIAALSWRYIFGMTVLLAVITFIGLYKFTPSDNNNLAQPLNIKRILKSYYQLITMPKFIGGVICSALAIIPIISWIGLSPTIIMKTEGLSVLHYAVYQFFSISGLAISSILMQFIAGRFSFYRLIMSTNCIAFFGIIIGFIFHAHTDIVIFGLFLYSFGLGIFNNLIMRLIMIIPNQSTSVVSSLMVFIQTATFAIGIEGVNYICKNFGYTLFNFTLISFVVYCIAFTLIVLYALRNKHRQWE
jgi:DHA1 family multidrug/chloramphenicol efflux transport protein-like MFS transporter